jgi:hypothetical protein
MPARSSGPFPHRKLADDEAGVGVLIHELGHYLVGQRTSSSVALEGNDYCILHQTEPSATPLAVRLFCYWKKKDSTFLPTLIPAIALLLIPSPCTRVRAQN